MRISCVWILLVFSIGGTGCSIHPLPDDVTRDSTVDIVKKIRCETKKAVELHDPQGKLNGAAIGYDFTFTITEDNNASGSAIFTLPFTNGTFTLALGAGESKQRINEREFLIKESFSELRKEDCSTQAFREHWRYPITGIVGM